VWLAPPQGNPLNWRDTGGCVCQVSKNPLKESYQVRRITGGVSFDVPLSSCYVACFVPALCDLICVPALSFVKQLPSTA